MNLRWAVLLWVVVLAGCQSTHEQLVAEGYPPAFADGFQDGCGSGRDAAGANGLYKKDVPRYLKEKLYAGGWDDGYRQCQGEALSRDRPDAGSIFNDRDRRWEQQKTQDAGRAYKPK